MVGDRTSDLKAGLAFGARSFLVRRDAGLESLMERLLDMNDRGDGVI